MAYLNYLNQKNMVLRAKRNMQLANVRTSVVLETAIWDAVGEILINENLDLNGFCQMVDQRQRGFNRTPTARVDTATYYRTLKYERK